MSARIKINGDYLDLKQDETIAYSLNGLNVINIDVRRGSVTNTFTVPLTTRNQRIINFPIDINFTIKEWTFKLLDAELYQGSALVAKGSARITSVNPQDKTFSLTFLGDNATLFQIIKEINIGDYNTDENYTPDTVQTYQDLITELGTEKTWEEGYLYSPINYNRGHLKNNFEAKDVRKHVFVKYLLNKLFEEKGYTANGNLWDSDFLNNLVLPFQTSRQTREDIFKTDRVFEKVNKTPFIFQEGDQPANIDFSQPIKLAEDFILGDLAGQWDANEVFTANANQSFRLYWDFLWSGENLGIRVYEARDGASGSEIIENSRAGQIYFQILIDGQVIFEKFPNVDNFLPDSRYTRPEQNKYKSASGREVGFYDISLESGQTMEVQFFYRATAQGAPLTFVTTFELGDWKFFNDYDGVNFQSLNTYKSEHGLPDFLASNLLKDVLKMTCGFVELDSDRRLVTFSYFKEVNEKIIRAENWSNKLTGIRNIDYTQPINNYALINWYRYTKESQEKQSLIELSWNATSVIPYGDGALLYSRDYLEEQKEIVKLDSAPTGIEPILADDLTNTTPLLPFIPIFDKPEQEGGEPKNRLKPRFLLYGGIVGSPSINFTGRDDIGDPVNTVLNQWNRLYFFPDAPIQNAPRVRNNLCFDHPNVLYNEPQMQESALLNKYYSEFSAMVESSVTIEADFLLDATDILNFKQSTPVLLTNNRYQGYYFVESIKEFTNESEPTTVVLRRLYIK
jgi:hypothetical protein